MAKLFYYRPEHCQIFIEAIDKDNSGTLTLDEFLNLMVTKEGLSCVKTVFQVRNYIIKLDNYYKF